MTILSRYTFHCQLEQAWKRNGALLEYYVSRLQPSLQDLHAAIYSQNIPKVRWVLSEMGRERVDSSIRSTTALSLAVSLGSIELVDALLGAGADPNKLSCDGNGRMETPLSTATRLGHLRIARRLVSEGAMVDVLDQDGHSPLWIATRERSLPLVKLLVEAGAGLDLAGKSSLSPIFLATKFYGREHIAEYLIQQGCRVNTVDLEGRGPFYWALVNGMERLVRLLLRAGVSPSSKDLALILGRKPTWYLADHPAFAAWLRAELKRPPPLKRQAVSALRGALSKGSGPLARLLRSLPLPGELRSSLLLHPSPPSSPPPSPLPRSCYLSASPTTYSAPGVEPGAPS